MERQYRTASAKLSPDERAELAWRAGHCDEAMDVLLGALGDCTGHVGRSRLRCATLYHCYNIKAMRPEYPVFNDVVWDSDVQREDLCVYLAALMLPFAPDTALTMLNSVGKADVLRWSDAVEASFLAHEVFQRNEDVKLDYLYTENFLKRAQAVCSPASLYLPRALCARAVVYRNMGDYKPAKLFVEEALSMLLEHHNSRTAEYADALREYGRILAGMGDYDAAAVQYKKSAEIFDSVFHKGAYPGLSLKLDLAETSLLAGNNEAASLFVDEFEKADVQGMWALSSLFRVTKIRGEVLLSDNMPLMAGMLFDTGLKITEAQSEDGSNIMKCNPIDLRDMLCAAGYASILDGKSEQAMEYYERQLELDRRLVHDVFLFMPESKRGAYRASMEAAANRLFCANREGTVTMDGGKVVDMPASNRNACSGLLYDASLLLKGVLQESSAGLRRMLDNPGSGEAARVASELTSLRRSMAAAGAADAATAARADSLEREFLALAGDEADFMKFADVRWQQVRDALAVRQVAVEFVCAVDGGMEYYSAEVLRRGMERPQHVFLFACKEGDEPFGSDPYGSSVAYRKVWRKIAPLLKEGDEVCFSPAGQLHGVAVEYVKTPAGTRMCDVYGMRRLSSTRRLLEDGRSGGSMAAVFGGLNYNTDAELMEMYAEAYKTDGFMAMRGADTRGVERQPWQYLPGTQAEADAVARSMRAANREVELYTGDDGMEETFKALSGRGHGALHVATHGFYNTAGRRSLNPIAAQYSGDNALDRCGLVMSGANNAWLGGMAVAEGVDDGILTAHEIAEMDLTAAEVVVLSACSTGAGDVTGDGVYGLQRGFKLAGAGSIVMSLWPVADAAASLFMQEFYKSLNAGNGHHAALADARAGLMAAGYTDPAHWAAFIILD